MTTDDLGPGKRPADQVDIDLLLSSKGHTPQPRDLALEALAQIQAMDAAPQAAAFRQEWMHGRPVKHWTTRVHWRGSREAHAALTELADSFAARYAWTHNQADAFILSDIHPVLLPYSVSVERQAPADRDNPATSAWTNEIVIRVRPQVTKKQVADAYEAQRRVILEAQGVEPGERNRATTVERTRDLAVLGYRVWRGDFSKWREAFDTYAVEHPEDADLYVSPRTGRVQVKTFRRDLRNAYARVTGLDLYLRDTSEDEEADDA